MPYKRRRRRRRRTGIKSQVYKNKRKLTMLSKAMEMKHLDGTGTLATCDTSGEKLWLNQVDQGDLPESRDGKKIQARRIFIRGYISNTNGTPADGIMRIILVRRKDAGGNTFDVDNIDRGLLYNDTSGGYTVLSNMNTRNAHNYDVLLDETFGYDTTQYSQIPFKIVKKLNHQATYTLAVTVDDADCSKNALFLFCFTNQATEANAPSVVYEYRYSFLDA